MSCSIFKNFKSQITNEFIVKIKKWITLYTGDDKPLRRANSSRVRVKWSNGGDDAVVFMIFIVSLLSLLSSYKTITGGV